MIVWLGFVVTSCSLLLSVILVIGVPLVGFVVIDVGFICKK